MHKVFEVRIRRILYNARTGGMNRFHCIEKFCAIKESLHFRDVIYAFKLKNEEYIADVSCCVPRWGVFQRVRNFRPLGGRK